MATKPRAVLDTNVFISGLINPVGVPGRLLKSLRSKQFVLVTSEEINEEIIEVMSRPKLQGKYGLAAHLFDVAFILWEVAEVVRDVPTVRVASDPDDNKFLATALTGDAHYLITGDVGDLLPIKQWKGIRIITPNEFMGILFRE